jgi:hypothetical protein
MGKTDFEKWVATEPGIMPLIESITATNQPLMEQAKEAFYKMGDLLRVPKFPEDITEEMAARFEAEGIDDPRSLFEEVGIVRYLEPEDDPRGIVLAALYNTKRQQYANIDLCALEHFGGRKKIPNEYMVYYTGQDADALLHFTKQGESWFREGVKYGAKIIHHA